ncbi:hypothetical protein F5148DRAFT_1269062 [Russula earlei]|uniref:Uncharacterized protein n=1 Tax=Russula earlei TaxID=71964 RepID=A0ACC0TQY3_9AGAM|nr:hypothetical protein F5148DRAFT_1269062 [Russula earlei]
MRPFAHVLAIFCLAVGIAPFFAHASSTSTSTLNRPYANLLSHLSPLKLTLPRIRPEDVPQAHMDKVWSIRREMAGHMENLESKFNTLKTAGYTADSSEYQNAVEEHIRVMRPLKDQAVVLNRDYVTPVGNVVLNAGWLAMDPNHHLKNYQDTKKL